MGAIGKDQRFGVSLIILSMIIGTTNCDIIKCEPSHDLIVTINDTLKRGAVILGVDTRFSIAGSCELMALVNGTMVLNTDLRDESCKGSPTTSTVCNIRCQAEVVIVDVRVVFTIEDIDLYPPRFPKPLFRANISEGVPPGTAVFFFDKDGSRVTDEDCWSNINYALQGDYSGPFSMKASNVITSKEIVYDDEQEYNITVVATVDMRNSSSTTTTTLTIQVDDVDDKPPEFSTYRYDLDITEETISTNGIVADPPLRCMDLDVGINTTVVYNFTDTNPYFQIQHDTGQLLQQSAFDRESMAEWQTEILCYQEDDITKFDTAILHVNVIDVNDNAAVFDPTSRQVSLAENAFSGTYVTSVTATDADLGENAKIIYRIDQQSDTFQIDNTNGIITVQNSDLLDREQVANITIVVYAVDKDGNHSANNVTVVVSLIDANDNSPTFTQDVYRFFFNTSDVNTVIGTVDAIDDDVPDTPNSNVTYTISQAWQDSTTIGLYPMDIDTLTGNVSINGSVLPNTSYTLIVEACDNPVNTGERRCGITRVVAAYTLNTSFTSTSLSMEVVENSIVGTMIGQLPIYGNHYEVDSSNFTIDLASHMLTTAIELDREEVDSYNVTVRVFSDTLGPLGQVNITIHVTDMNDNPPLFDQDEYYFAIPQSQSENNVIGTVKSSDADAGKNSERVYTVQQNSFSDVFDFDPVSGSISIKDTWWTSTSSSFYQLTVTVSDRGVPSLQTTAMVYISEMSSDEESLTIRLGTVADSSSIDGNKTHFENEIANLLGIDRVNIVQVESVPDSKKLIRSYINMTGHDVNDTNISLQDLQRLVVGNWAPIQDLFREPVRYMYTTETSTGGLNTAEIALITMAGVILIGGIIAIVVICKMWNRHVKSQRLYESLRRPSTLYDDQEIRLDFGDERGTHHINRDFRRSRSKEPEQLEGSFGLGYINTAYTADDDNAPKSPAWGSGGTPRIPRWSTSDSLKDAMESLQELTNRLNAEDNISRITSLSREHRSMRSYKSSVDETPIIGDIQEKHKELRDDTDDYITPIVDYPMDSGTVSDGDTNDNNDDTVTKTNSGIFYVNSFRKQCGDKSDADDQTVIVEATAF